MASADEDAVVSDPLQFIDALKEGIALNKFTWGDADRLHPDAMAAWDRQRLDEARDDERVSMFMNAVETITIVWIQGGRPAYAYWLLPGSDGTPGRWERTR